MILNYKLLFATVLLSFILSLNGCGLKGPPTPIFPTSTSQISTEIKRRDVEQEKDKLLEKKNYNNLKDSNHGTKISPNENN